MFTERIVISYDALLYMGVILVVIGYGAKPLWFWLNDKFIRRRKR